MRNDLEKKDYISLARLTVLQEKEGFQWGGGGVTNEKIFPTMQVHVLPHHWGAGQMKLTTSDSIYPVPLSTDTPLRRWGKRSLGCARPKQGFPSSQASLHC